MFESLRICVFYYVCVSYMPIIFPVLVRGIVKQMLILCNRLVHKQRAKVYLSNYHLPLFCCRQHAVVLPFM